MEKQKVLIVRAMFYQDIADKLLKGATDVLTQNGIDFDLIDVPGCFEIPAVISFYENKYHGVIALGCVIRGETTHYDYVCEMSARALMDLSVVDHVPLGYGILTVENEDQAYARLQADCHVGARAAEACVRMRELLPSFYEEDLLECGV